MGDIRIERGPVVEPDRQPDLVPLAPLAEVPAAGQVHDPIDLPLQPFQRLDRRVLLFRCRVRLQLEQHHVLDHFCLLHHLFLTPTA